MATQSSAAPYLAGELLGQGSLLSSYSPLAASEMTADATLLSGQVTAGVSTLIPPCPVTQGATATAGGSPAANGAGAAAGAPSATPCATAEPEGAQAADDVLRDVVPQITASAAYREGGLIAITFAAPGEGESSSSAAATDSPPIAYPAGTQSSTLTATGAPGVLLLSPFLRHPGGRIATAVDQLAPRKSLEELLTDSGAAQR
jgi:hypothetical protein